MNLPNTCMIAALGALLLQPCQGGLILELIPFPQVTGSEVMLKDIVRDPSSLPDTWKERTVMKAPASDTPVEYGISSVASALQKYPDMQDVTLKGQATLSIARTGPTLGLDSIEKAIRSYVAENEPWKGRRVEIRCDPLSEKVTISDAHPIIEVNRVTAQNHLNKFTFTATLAADGSTKQTINISASVTPLTEVWAAKKSISRGQLIDSAENLEVQFLPVDSMGSLIPATESIDGFELGCNVNANQPLNRHTLVQPVCSQNGEQININADRGSLHVMLRAKALSNGRKGERIMCVNELSKRRLLVRLTGPREGTLDF